MEKSTKLILGIGIPVILIGGSLAVYFAVKETPAEKKLKESEKAEKDQASAVITNPVSTGQGTTRNPSGCSQLDYTKPLSAASAKQTAKRADGKIFKLGEDIVVKGGQTIHRVDHNGCDQGDTITAQVGVLPTIGPLAELLGQLGIGEKALGTIWHINPSGVNIVVKAKPGYDFPFYKMNINNLV